MNDDQRRYAIGRFDEIRRFSRSLFDAVHADAYYDQPIPLRNPVVFYEGHFSAFNFITLNRRALGEAPIDEDLETLFERGIDPDDEADADSTGVVWPSRREVIAYTETTDVAVRAALESQVLTDDRNPLLVNSEAVWACLEHEIMHHETLLYMIHWLDYDQKTMPREATRETGGNPPRLTLVKIPEGRATLGASRLSTRFGWDNEFEEHTVEVPGFSVADFPVTNTEYAEFVEAGCYQNHELWRPEAWEWVRDQALKHPLFWERDDQDWYWRGLWERIPLPASWPVWVTHAEAEAFARWRGKRLLTEPEYHRAAFSTPDGTERLHPWGDDAPAPKHGNFDFQSWDPMPVDAHPDGASAWGVHDLIGNGWEWTSSEFGPLPGFREMASYRPYSSDFFDGVHYVMKGASPVTAKDLVRRSFRNWFRSEYPFMYAKFRLAESE